MAMSRPSSPPVPVTRSASSINGAAVNSAYCTVPSSVGVVSLVMPSIFDDPLSLASARFGVDGAPSKALEGLPILSCAEELARAEG